MTILTSQTCDGCGVQRVLAELAQAMNGGWREVTQGKHLCPACISNALNALARATDERLKGEPQQDFSPIREQTFKNMTEVRRHVEGLES